VGSLSTLVIIAWAGFIILLERRFPYDRQPFFRREFWTDLLWFSTSFSMVMGWLAYAVTIPAIDSLTGWSHLRGLRGWPIWAQLGVSLFSHDLFIYTFHRMMHRSPTLWRIHEAHHSVLDVDWIGGSRGHVIENLITGTAELAPIMLFMSPEVAVIKPAIDACWGMWIHSNVDLSLGPLDYVINGPRMHRWHHAREVQNINFATKFAFWDWLFKTAYAPQGTRPKSYGLGERFPSNIVAQQLFAFRRASPRQDGQLGSPAEKGVLT
jgi:sterol desaturase/sphingolipid hydroxylase (fatty acid hydroxylase superfamily)